MTDSDPGSSNIRQNAADYLWMGVWSLPAVGLIVSAFTSNDAELLLMAMPMIALGAFGAGIQRGMARWDNSRSPRRT